MLFMILRKSDATTEAGAPSGLAQFRAMLAQAGVLRAADEMAPSDAGLRLGIDEGRVSRVDGPFPAAELCASFALIDVANRDEALAWAARWPQDGNSPVELEVRQMGCPGGCAEIPPVAPGEGKRFMMLLRSDAALEADTMPSEQTMATLNARNAIDARRGILLAGDGLRGTALGARVKLAGGRATVIDGPFTEVKELIAGYWMLRLSTIEDAIDWAAGYPFPSGPQVVIEIREVRGVQDAGFDIEQRAAEQRMRARQLETGMQQLDTPLAWR